RRADVSMEPHRREVEVLLRRRAAVARDDVAVEIAHDQVVVGHRVVVERRRREHEVAVGEARREVPGRAGDEAAVEHLARDGQELVAHRPRVVLVARRGAHDTTSGFTRLSGLPPANNSTRPSTIMRLWLTSVSYVAPPMCGARTTL